MGGCKNCEQLKAELDSANKDKRTWEDYYDTECKQKWCFTEGDLKDNNIKF